MIELSELPKDPLRALTVILQQMQQRTNGAATIESVRKRGNPIYTDLMVFSVSGIKAAQYIPDIPIQSQVISLLTLRDEITLDQYGEKLERCTALIMAIQLDEHFISNEDAKLFDEAELTIEEKSEIRSLMAEARRLTELAKSLSPTQKRKVLHWISKVEDELVREKTRFQTFVAAASIVFDLVKKAGNDVKPIAEAISEARTITERKVEGYRQIVDEEKPKQIEDKSPNSADNKRS